MPAPRAMQGAIQYLEEAVTKQPTKLGLRLTLADLFMKLSKTDKAVDVCDGSIEMLGGSESREVCGIGECDPSFGRIGDEGSTGYRTAVG